MTIQLRDATADDIAVLHALAARCLPLDRFTEELLAEKMFPASPRPGWRWGVRIAAEGDAIVGFMQSIVREAPAKAWVGVFAVSPDRRRMGVAKRLYESIAADWPVGAASEILAVPGNYFHPGVDPRYTEALCFIESIGYERFKDCVNLVSPLDREFGTREDIARLAETGCVIRRAVLGDGPQLADFLGRDFGDDWAYEAGLALAATPPGLHLALEKGAIIGFAAHSTQNREWGFFGPMGTTAAARGRGVGRVLLRLCLNDLRGAGHRTAVIPWVGPISFYHRWAGSRVERVFWRYRRT